VADTLHLSLNSGPMTDSWNFFMVSYANAADLPPVPGGPTAGFQVALDGTEATFTNTSANATDYSWDFGDGGMSADENPVYTYATEGTYTVTLTATDAMGESDMASSEVIISTAVFTAANLSNAAGKVWKLDGANSYFVGSGPGANDYWPGVTADDVLIRDCQFDDEFIFTDGGVMEFDSKGSVWAEGYMLGGNECLADGDLQAPYDVCGSGTHAFTASDTQITVNGNGAYIGFNKPYNGAELDGVVAPPASITYEVLNYAAVGNTEVLTITINYGSANDHWTMRLVSEN